MGDLKRTQEEYYAKKAEQELYEEVGLDEVSGRVAQKSADKVWKAMQKIRAKYPGSIAKGKDLVKLKRLKRQGMLFARRSFKK